MSISAADVKTLRDRTGAGMMDCKKALTEANGDMDEAVEILRKKGQKVADKRADREANQGVIISIVSEDGKKAAAVELNCETDFVARNEEFSTSATDFAQIVFDNQIADIDALKASAYKNITVAQRLEELTGKIGEKIDISKAIYLESDGTLVEYIHPGNQLVTLVEFDGEVSDAEAAKDVAMQVAAMKPVATHRDEVSQDLLDKELEIAKEQLINEGKTPEIAEKAAIGKIRRFYEENVLLEQKFVKDASMTVQAYLKSKGVPTVRTFKRLQLGENA